MKKRILATLLTISSVFGSPVISYAEGFEIRNGIYLGDTFEEVIEKNDLGFESENFDAYEENDEGICYRWSNNGKIAGVEDAQIRFEFEDKVLTGVVYQFPDTNDKESVDSEYSTFYKALTRKYGNALDNPNGSIELITSRAFNCAFTEIALSKTLLDGVGDVRDYDEWYYREFEDYNVKIDLVSYYDGKSYSEADFTNLIGYKMFTDDEENSAIADKLAENQEMENDL